MREIRVKTVLEEQKEQRSFRNERPGMDAWSGAKENYN
jgi:hypothetical protein